MSFSVQTATTTQLAYPVFFVFFFFFALLLNNLKEILRKKIKRSELLHRIILMSKWALLV